MKLHPSIWIFLVMFISCNSQQVWHQAEIDPETYRFDRYAGVEENEEINALIAPYKAEVDKEMNEVIAILNHELTKKRPESTLGNFVADILEVQGEKYINKDVAFAAQNYGGIRVPAVASGDITKGKVFEIMPFDNTMLILESKGSIIQRLCDKIASSGGWPISKGINFVIKDEKATEIKINGESLDPDVTYTYVLPDYIANGGDGCDFLLDEKRVDTKIMIREVMIEYLKNLTATGETVSQEITGRITYKN